MAFLETRNVRITGMSAAVPSVVEENIDIYKKWGEYDHFVSTTGIERHRKSGALTCSSDLCKKAAQALLDDLDWNKEEIDALVFVSQTQDYIAPATSCLLQHELGLKEGCLALDISLGCSGWVYALSVIAALMQNGSIRKGLLLAGDTILKLASPKDKSTWPLFGDAGTATALEYLPGAEGIKFSFNTDGSGAEAIIVRDGGYRYPVSADSFKENERGEDIVSNRLQVELNGMDVFSFGISKAPKSVNGLLDHFQIEKDAVDCFTFHQANLFMNEKIRKKLKLPVEKVPYSLKDFANTSCASIPLTLVTQRGEELRNGRIKHVVCGFGVGLSWGSAYFETEFIVVSKLKEV